MMCNCLSHCRLHEETIGGSLPSSEHAPSCEDYKKERFCRVRLKSLGSSFVDTPERVNLFIEVEGNPHEYEVSDIFMTQDQFDRLKEFSGF